MKLKTIRTESGGQPGFTPFLWFKDNTEKAVRFYVSVFNNSEIGDVALYGDAGPGPKGTVTSVMFRLDGQEFTAINEGPQFRFTEAVSFVMSCHTLTEADELWEKLSEGGEGHCGWVKDKYGLSWQVVPSFLNKLLNGKDTGKAQRVMKAMLQMKQLDIEVLQAA